MHNIFNSIFIFTYKNPQQIIDYMWIILINNPGDQGIHVDPDGLLEDVRL